MDDYTYNCYSLKSIRDEITDEKLVEVGLSRGELMQSLMDRIQPLIVDNGVELMNENLERLGFHLNPLKIRSTSQKEQSLKDIEDVLYDSDGEDFIDSYWTFEDEILYIQESA